MGWLSRGAATGPGGQRNSTCDEGAYVSTRESATDCQHSNRPHTLWGEFVGERGEGGGGEGRENKIATNSASRRKGRMEWQRGPRGGARGQSERRRRSTAAAAAAAVADVSHPRRAGEGGSRSTMPAGHQRSAFGDALLTSGKRVRLAGAGDYQFTSIIASRSTHGRLSARSGVAGWRESKAGKRVGLFFFFFFLFSTEPWPFSRSCGGRKHERNVE